MRGFYQYPLLTDEQREALRGLPGEKGDAGLRGDRGAAGEKGDTGLKGDRGEQGIKGDQGTKGDTGAAGKDAEAPRRAILAYAGVDLTWTYPSAFAVGIVPVIEAIAAGPTTGNGSAALLNVQLVGDPTATSCKLRVNSIPAAAVSVTGLVNLNLFQQAPTGVKVHVTARAP